MREFFHPLKLGSRVERVEEGRGSIENAETVKKMTEDEL